MKLLVLLSALIMSSVFAEENLSNSQIALNELRYNNSPIVKEAAISALANHLNDPSVQRELQTIVENQFENTNVRIKAAHALSRIATKREVLVSIANAHDRSNDNNFRAEMLKSLYKAVPADSRLRSVVVYNLQNAASPIIRKGAAFALMNVASDPQYKTVLENVCLNSRESAEVKVEALKSLYSNRATRNYLDFLENIVNNRFENTTVRQAAIRVMKATSSRSRAIGVINNVIRYESDFNLKAMALKSMDLNLRYEDIRWLRPSSDPRSNVERDPFNL